MAGMHERFHLLTYGLALVLAFIGAKWPTRVPNPLEPKRRPAPPPPGGSQ